MRCSPNSTPPAEPEPRPCVRRGVIHHPDDIYFLERDEIAGTESRNSSVSERRELWARNRRLTPPLLLGTMPKFFTKPHENAIAKMTAPAEAGDGMLRGMPASSGRVTGVARVSSTSPMPIGSLRARSW